MGLGGGGGVSIFSVHVYMVLLTGKCLSLKLLGAFPVFDFDTW